MIVRQQRGPPRSRQRGSALPERFQDGDGRRSAPWDTATGTLRTTLTGHGGYATLLPDGRYQVDGDPGDDVWWAIKLCRLGLGELDPYVPGMRRLEAGQVILPAR